VGRHRIHLFHHCIHLFRRRDPSHRRHEERRKPLQEEVRCDLLLPVKSMNFRILLTLPMKSRRSSVVVHHRNRMEQGHCERVVACMAFSRLERAGS